MYAIVAMPFDTLKILYLKHHRAASDGWIMNLLCDMCFEEFEEILVPIISNCNFELECILCLRQPPSLRGLALQAVFHFTFISDQFELTRDITHDQYVVNSN